MQKLKVGVIGCGQIAQIMHLHYLHELPHFELAAISDLSPTNLEHVGEKYGVARRYLNYEDLLAQEDVEAVLVTTRDHAPISIAAARAGKHVMTEKPIAFTLEDAEAVIQAAREAKVKLMVAYMKRYDPAFEYALRELPSLDALWLLRVHDFAGTFSLNPQIYDLSRGSDIPEKVVKEEQEKVEADLARAIGSKEKNHLQTYTSLLHLCTHDATILRAAYGSPDEVVYAEILPGARSLAVLRYGERARCVWEHGVLRGNTAWDETFTAYSVDKTVEVRFPYPYLRNSPTTVHVKEREGEAFVERTVTASYDEAFRREWRHFYECVAEDKPPLTSGEEAKADVKMLIDIARKAIG